MMMQNRPNLAAPCGKSRTLAVPTDRPAAIKTGVLGSQGQRSKRRLAVRLDPNQVPSGCQTLRAAGSIRHHWFDIADVGLHSV